MDGGKGVRPKTATNVTKNLAAVKTFMENQNNDIFLFQEVDKKAKRSYNINEYEGLKQDFDGTAAYAAMFNSLYIPYPVAAVTSIFPSVTIIFPSLLYTPYAVLLSDCAATVPPLIVTSGENIR